MTLATSLSDTVTDDEHTPDESGILAITIRRHGEVEGVSLVGLAKAVGALADAADGLVATMPLFTGETGVVDPDDPDQIAVPVGPVRIIGTVEEWRTALDRARSEPVSAEDFSALLRHPLLKELDPDPVDFFVLDTD